MGITAFATDPNGPAVTYRLLDSAGGRFAIDAATGVVVVADADLLAGDATYTITVQVSDGAGGAATASFTIKVLSANPPFLDHLIAAVSDLRQQGVLNNGNANALVVKLNAAQKSLAKGNLQASVNQVEAFRNQVSAFRGAGKLTGPQADELLGLADAIITAILADQ